MLDDKVAALARGKNFATITTLGDDGTPTTQVMWVDSDGEHILMNTEVHRKKYRNLQNDDRVTVTILDAKNPYSFAEVRGRLVESTTGPEAREHIDQLAQKYMDMDEYPGQIRSERVILKIAPDYQYTR